MKAAVIKEQQLLKANELLHKEADKIIYDGELDVILKTFGTPHYTGSYALNLMTWRDLDIYVATNDLSPENFFELGKKLVCTLNAVKMHFRNELIGKTAGLPSGLYWGIYLGDEGNEAWKIDIWAMNNNECRHRLEYCNNLKKLISPLQKINILTIKSEVWRDPAYRKTFSSADIYKAVLEYGVTDIDGFRTYLH